jgi:type II secretory pathway predicted ATPase ExeA
MYEAFFGFHERPFQLTPNPRFLFLNPGHREALATLRYGLTSSLGITLLLGEAGTGMTTLLRAALHAERRPEHRLAVLSNPTLAPADFYEILADRFGLPDTAGSKGRFLLAFERDLLERHRSGGLTAIVIDEAQSLTYALFEEIRLLANLETATAKLVNVVLVGQPELAERLNDPSLRQLKQRVVLRAALEPLNLEWSASYVASRIRVAGANPAEVFTKDAIAAIYEASRGIPRTIGVVCENALLAGFAAQRKPVDRSIVTDICRGLDLPVDGRPHPSGEALTEEGVTVLDPDVVPMHRHAAEQQRAAAEPDARVEAPDQEAAEPPHHAPDPEPRSRRSAARGWFSSRRREPEPDEPEAEDKTRIFKFF